MILPILASALLLQMSPAQAAALRKYRYGLSAERIEAMGEDGFDRLFRSKTPDADAGFMRGVSEGVYVDAYRENTARRYRAPRPLAERTRLLALDRQMRFLGVLLARNAWLFTGGNAVDPESDALEYAQAERRLYTFKNAAPADERAQRRLAAYRARIRSKLRKATLYGAMGDEAKGRAQIDANLGKIDLALDKAKGLCRTPSERAVLLDFVANEAYMPTS